MKAIGLRPDEGINTPPRAHPSHVSGGPGSTESGRAGVSVRPPVPTASGTICGSAPGCFFVWLGGWLLAGLPCVWRSVASAV